MVNRVKLILVLLALVSCELPQRFPKSNSEYFNKPPDLSEVVYEGGDGKSLENAIVIRNAKNERNGVAAEYAYISKKHGEKFTDWKPLEQYTSAQNNRRLDVVKVQIIQVSDTILYYFDITDFFGKY